MAKDRPRLVVQAEPVSTAISSGNVSAAGVELYDQQTVRLALEFSEAFKDLSLSAAQLAGTLKKESNAEEIQRGQDLINTSQKSYKQLVESGEIKPSENPWMAVGAQMASGTIEGQKARAHFLSIYNKRAEEDPAFFDGPEGFSALAAQYTANVNTYVGNAPYLSRAFYESFNPFIASMGMKHEENMVSHREQKIAEGITASVAQAVSDTRPDALDLDNAAFAYENGTLKLESDIQRAVDMGYSATKVNEAVVNALVLEAKQGNKPEVALKLLETLKSGTDSLGNTRQAKALLAQNSAAISDNLSRLTNKKSNAFRNEVNNLVGSVMSGQTSPETAKEQLTYLLTGEREGKPTEQPKYRFTASEVESKLPWAMSEIDRAVKQQEVMRKQAVEDFMYRQAETIETGNDASLQHLAGDAYVDAALNKLGDLAELNNISPKEWATMRSTFGERFRKAEGYREEQAALRQEEVLWTGSQNYQGIRNRAFQQVSQFFSGLGEMAKAEQLDQPSSQKAEAPDWASMLRDLQDSRENRGMVVGSDKMEAQLKMDYGRIDREVLKVFEQDLIQRNPNWGGTLAPRDTDEAAVLQAKAGARSTFKYLRMSLGATLGDTRESGLAAKTLQQYLTTAEVEQASQSVALTDTLQASFVALENNLPIEQVIPGNGPGSKMMQSLLLQARERYLAGDKPSDIARDMVTARVMRPLGTTEVNLSDPYMFVEFTTGTASDAAMYQDRFRNFRNSNRLTEPDSVHYLNMVVERNVRKHLSGPDYFGNMKGAMRAAEEEVLENHIMFRGSLVPKQGLNAYITEDFLSVWMDMQGFPPNATLVPVLPRSDGSVLMAVRVSGQAISTKLISTEDLNRAKRSPEFIQKIETNRKEREEVEKKQRMGVEEATVQGWITW